MNAAPRVALPLIIIWLSIGIPSKGGIIFLGAVFPIFMNARGVKTTPQELVCEIGFRDLPGIVQC